MLKKLGLSVKLGLAIIFICLLVYPLAISAVPKDGGKKIPTREEWIINDIDASMRKIIVAQRKLGKLVTKLDAYTTYQGTEGKGKDWPASMVIAYEFKQISLRHLAGVALVKQMLYLREEVFSLYLTRNFDLIMNFFTTLNVSSLNTIEANHKYILNDTVVKASEEGIKEVEKIYEYMVKIFSHFIER